MTKTFFHIAILALFLLGCKSVEPMPTASLVGQLPNADQPETLIFGADDEVLQTERGVEVRIVYESDVSHGILKQPGLKFSASGLPDYYTAGLGRFYVFGQYVLVEHDWPSRYTHPKLVVTFLPTAPETVKSSWDEAVNLVVEAVKKRGIGFSGYASDGDLLGEEITVYFKLLEEAHLLQVDINRFTNTMVFGVHNHYDNEPMDPDIWLKSAKRIHSRVEIIGGQLHPIAHQLLRACLPSKIDLRMTQNESGKRTPEKIPSCVDSILDEFPMGALELHLSSRVDSTYVPDFHAGNYVGEVKEKQIDRWYRLFRDDVRDPALRQEIRRQIRRSYDQLIACGRVVPPTENELWLEFGILPTGELEIDSRELQTPTRQCFADVLFTRWELAPRKEHVREKFYFISLIHLPE